MAPDLTPYTDYFTLPGNERYYDVDLGLVHLYAIDSDSHEPDGNTATSKQAPWLKDEAGRVEVLLRPRLLPPPAATRRAITAAARTWRWPFEAWGAEVGARRPRSRLRAPPGRRHPVLRRRHWAARARTPFDKPALPETKFRDADTHGAMLITATTTGITYEFWSVDGKKLDSLTVPKTLSLIASHARAGATFKCRSPFVPERMIAQHRLATIAAVLSLMDRKAACLFLLAVFAARPGARLRHEPGSRNAQKR